MLVKSIYFNINPGTYSAGISYIIKFQEKKLQDGDIMLPDGIIDESLK